MTLRAWHRLLCLFGFHAFRRGPFGTLSCGRCERRPVVNPF